MGRLELRANMAGPIALGAFALAPLAVVAIVPAIAVKLVALAATGGLALGGLALGSRKLVIDDKGITARGLLGATSAEWNEVDYYWYWSQGDAGMYAGAGGLAAVAVVALVRAVRKSGKNRQFGLGRLTLVTRDGKRIRLDQRYHHVPLALDRTFAELHPRLRAANDFTPFALDDAELRHTRKGALALADIDRVDVAGARVAIRRRGKRFAWASESMRRIKNVMLFLEELAERGLIVRANREVFVPPETLDKLELAASRQAALPAARVVPPKD
jgi:hypothetical protein